MLASQEGAPSAGNAKPTGKDPKKDAKKPAKGAT